MNSAPKECSETASNDSSNGRAASPRSGRSGGRNVVFIVALAIVALIATVGVLSGLLAKANKEIANLSSDSSTLEGAAAVPVPVTAPPLTNTTFTSEEIKVILTMYTKVYGLGFGVTTGIAYHKHALQWMMAQKSFPMSEQRLVQRYALACFYYATSFVPNPWHTDGGELSWTSTFNWLVDEDECSWQGITCSDVTGFDTVTAPGAEGSASPFRLPNKAVTGISAGVNGLSGSLPPELILLKDSLESLDIFKNPITHNHDDNDWLGEMTNLKNLFVGQTNFVSTQGVPSSIGKLTNMVELDCSFTRYTGPLVGETFAALTSLEYAVLSGNSYESSLPTELVSLPKLEFLYLQNSSLTGDMSFLPAMANTKMVEFWMDFNPDVRGTIPTEIGLVTTLQSFSITNCGLTGTLPAEFSDVPLQRFWCEPNNITGGSVTSGAGVQLYC